MRVQWLRTFLIMAFAAVVAVGCGGSGNGGDGDGGGGDGGSKGGTVVFGSSADPVALDPALVSDGESLRVIDQMMEGLVGMKEGTTELEPRLATEWEASEDGKEWTFKLRDDVEFHDGTKFDAEAVCFNFERWYNFKGSFQSADASYYWQTVFGGFKNNEPTTEIGESLYAGCEVKDDETVVISLTRPSSAFIGALSLTAFAIASPTALEKYNADEGKVDEEGVFRPTGSFATEHPIGTGPFKFKKWQREDRLEIVRNDEYWGEKAKLDRVIFRPISDNAARLQALQAGEIDGYDLVEPQDVETIENDDDLQLLERDPFNVAYVGINQKIKPMDKLEVRQALAHGLDRKTVVDNFYAGRGEVANQFMPDSVMGYADDVEKYDYDPERAKELLKEAGVKTPVEIEFWYPTDVTRPYMPDPKRNFEAFAASLAKSGFKVTPKAAPWDPDYLGKVNTGQAQVYLLGWTGDYADPDNFIGTFFRNQPQAQWGFTDDELKQTLEEALSETDEGKREELYQDANRQIMEIVPGVPYAHSKPALAFSNKVKGYKPSPVSLEPFAIVTKEE